MKRTNPRVLTRLAIGKLYIDRSLGTWVLVGTEDDAERETITIERLEEMSPDEVSAGIPLKFTSVGGDVQEGLLGIFPSARPPGFAVLVSSTDGVRQEWHGEYRLKDDTLTLSFTGVNVTAGPQVDWSVISKDKNSPRHLKGTYRKVTDGRSATKVGQSKPPGQKKEPGTLDPLRSTPAAVAAKTQLAESQLETKTATPRRANHFTTGASVRTIAYSADGKLIAIANGNSTSIMLGSGTSRVKDNWKPSVEILDSETGKTIVSLDLTTDEEDAVIAETRHVSHVLPDRFMRVRHYGLLANRGKKERLAQVCRLLGVGSPAKPRQEPPQTAAQWLQSLLGIDPDRCPCRGEVLLGERLPSAAGPGPADASPGRLPPWDTS